MDNKEHNIEIRLALTEAGFASMKEDLVEIKLKINEFIDVVTKKYVTKDELTDKLTLIQTQLKDVKQSEKNLWDLIAKWGPAVIIVVWIVLQKVL